MLTYHEALSLILQHIPEQSGEEVILHDAVGRYLREAPTAKVDLPPFLTSSVDGYALRLPFLSKLMVTDELPAGTTKIPNKLGPGEAVQVFTGSQLPPDTDAVVMIEDVDRDEQLLNLNHIPSLGENLRPRGEEMTVGQELLQPGTRITPPVLALLASSGNYRVTVSSKIKVAIVEIGSELQAPGETLRPGAVYSANGIALEEACRLAGAETLLLRSSDDFQEMERILDQALAFGDVVITSGGVSVGKHDHVKAIWARRQVEEIFWRVAIRPGKPLYFGRKEGKTIFGLPGNPVSTLVTFYLFVRPFLNGHYRICPESWIEMKTTVRLESAPHVDIFLRVSVNAGAATPLSSQGSHMLSGLAQAQALLRVPMGVGEITSGSTLSALFLDWYN